MSKKIEVSLNQEYDLPFPDNDDYNYVIDKNDNDNAVISDEEYEHLEQLALKSELESQRIALTYDKNIHMIQHDFFLDLMAQNTSKETLKTYGYHLKYFIKYIEGFRDYDEDDSRKYLTERIYKEYSRYLLNRDGFSQKSALSYLRTIRRFFYWCMDSGYISQEYKLKLPKTQESEPEIYTLDELKLLLKKPDLKTCNFTEFRVWVFINFLVSTGQRLTSCLNIKISNLDFKNNIVALNITKNKYAHTVEISKELKDILKDYLLVRKGEADDYLFCNSVGEKWDRRTAQEQVGAYNRKRGVNKTSIHSFRHTFAKNFIMNGGDAFVLQRILDHSTLDMTQNYVKLFGKGLKGTTHFYNPIKEVQYQEPKKKRIRMNINKK